MANALHPHVSTDRGNRPWRGLPLRSGKTEDGSHDKSDGGGDGCDHDKSAMERRISISAADSGNRALGEGSLR